MRERRRQAEPDRRSRRGGAREPAAPPTAGDPAADRRRADPAADRRGTDPAADRRGTDPAAALRDYWHPVSWAADLEDRPVSTELLGERVVLWRDAGGHPVAAADRCPHRGTALSLGTVDGRGSIVCPYHGWTFDAAGSCTHLPQLPAGTPVPERVRIAPYSCEERYGLVWVCLGEPAADIPAFPEWSEPGFRHVACAPYRWRTSATRMVENFSDVGHFGYLHDGFAGSRDDLVVPTHRVEQVGDELRFAVAGGSGLALRRRSRRERQQAFERSDYVLTLPFTVHRSTRTASGGRRAAFFAAQPHGPGASTGFCYLSRDHDLDVEDAAVAALQELLAEQDRSIVESQLPVEPPLDAASELHLPFDRVAVAYRRALRRVLEGPVAGPLEEPSPSPAWSGG